MYICIDVYMYNMYVYLCIHVNMYVYINIANVKPFDTSFSYLRGTMMAPPPALP